MIQNRFIWIERSHLVMHTDTSTYDFDSIIRLLQVHQDPSTALQSIFHALVHDLAEQLDVSFLSLYGPCSESKDVQQADYRLTYPGTESGCAEFDKPDAVTEYFHCPMPTQERFSGPRLHGQTVQLKIPVTDGDPWWITLHFSLRGEHWDWLLPPIFRAKKSQRCSALLDRLKSGLVGPISIINLRLATPVKDENSDLRFAEQDAVVGTRDWPGVASILPASFNLNVFEALIDGVWLLDTQGMTQYINPAFTETYSIPLDRAVNRFFHEFLVEESRQVFSRELTRALAGSPVSVDVAFLSPRLEPIWGRVTLTPLFPEDEQSSPMAESILCLVRELSSERQAVSERGHMELRLRKTQARVRLGLITRNSDGSEFHCTPEIYRIIGHNASQGPLTQDVYFSYIHPEDRYKVEEDWNSALSAKELTEQTEFRIRRPDHSLIWVTSQIENRVTPEGVLESITVSIQDITVHKKSENKLKKLLRENSRLARQAQETLEQERSRVSRELHDSVGQTITGIKLSAEWIKRKISDQDLLKERASDIANQSAFVLEEIRQICRQLNPVLLQKVGLEAATRELTDGWAWRNVETELELEIPRSLGPIDEERSLNLFRVIQELLHNVSKHSAAEHVLVALRWSEPQESNPLLQLEVTDNGKGFDIQSYSSGSGLIGLRDRASNLGGSVEVSSAPGKGTQVIFSVPIPSQEPITSGMDTSDHTGPENE